MNWIQVIYFKLKEISPIFSTANHKKNWLFFTSLPLMQMQIWKYETKSQSKGYSSQLLHWGMKFKLFISNWKRFDPYFPLLKTKKWARFLLPFRQSKWKYESMKPNLSQKVTKVNYFKNVNFIDKILIIWWILLHKSKIKCMQTISIMDDYIAFFCLIPTKTLAGQIE